MKVWVFLGAFLGFFGVVLGAFGAHILRNQVSTKAMEIFDTASHYQMIHALALVAIGLLSYQGGSFFLNLGGWSFLVGTLLFSGSLYLLAVTEIKSLGQVTPVGGLLFLVGWASMAIHAWKQS